MASLKGQAGPAAMAAVVKANAYGHGALGVAGPVLEAGAIIFNLQAKRIVQLMNSYREIRRSGHARIFDGSGYTETVYSYRLPKEWALVP